MRDWCQRWMGPLTGVTAGLLLLLHLLMPVSFWVTAVGFFNALIFGRYLERQAWETILLMTGDDAGGDGRSV